MGTISLYGVFEASYGQKTKRILNFQLHRNRSDETGAIRKETKSDDSGAGDEQILALDGLLVLRIESTPFTISTTRRSEYVADSVFLR